MCRMANGMDKNKLYFIFNMTVLAEQNKCQSLNSKLQKRFTTASNRYLQIQCIQIRPRDQLKFKLKGIQ